MYIHFCQFYQFISKYMFWWPALLVLSAGVWTFYTEHKHNLSPAQNAMTCLVLSLSCWALMSVSLGCPLCISCLAIWLTTATREAWLFISGSRLSNLEGNKNHFKSHNHQEQQSWRIMIYNHLSLTNGATAEWVQSVIDHREHPDVHLYCCSPARDSVYSVAVNAPKYVGLRKPKFYLNVLVIIFS